MTAIVAPAILTNASSVLAQGTSNRLARVIDRARAVVAQLAPLHVRAQLLVKGPRFYYAGLGLFAASALVCVGGSIESYFGHVVVFYSAATLAVLTGASAVFGLCAGCVLMVRETRLAVKSLEEEAKRVFTLARPASLSLVLSPTFALAQNAPCAPFLNRLHVSAERLHSSHAFR